MALRPRGPEAGPTRLAYRRPSAGRRGDGMEVLIQGERLLLRPWRQEDADGLVRLWTDGRVMRHVGFPNRLSVTRDDVLETIARARQAREIGRDSYRLAVTDRHTGEFMGEAAVGQVEPDGTSRPDIKLLPHFWGRGYGAEVISLLVDFTFGFTAATRIVLEPNVENAGARKAYTRAGFRPVGEAKRVDSRETRPEARGTVLVVYNDFVLKREEWRERSAAR